MTCKTHPDAPHGFMRDASHSAGEYVCECAFWQEPVDESKYMITVKEFFETFGYRITEGSDYGWTCYGPNSYSLSYWNGIHGQGGFAGSVVFDTEWQTVYEAEVCDYTHDRAYRLINPAYVEAHRKEAKQRNVNMDQAWDDVNFVDLDVAEDWLEKAQAIVAGKEYDTGVLVPIDFTDEELLTYMKMAHERNITFNQFVEDALRNFIDNRRHEIHD